MAAISFDQPSTGTVNAVANALSIKNSGTGGALECIVNSTTSSGIGVRNETGHGIWTESKGGYAGLVTKSATGEAIHAEANSTTAAAIGVVNNTGHGIWTESKGGYAGLVTKSATGEAINAETNSTTAAAIGVVNKTGFGIWAESKGNMTGIVGKSTTGHGIWGESLASNTGIVGKSATGNGVHAESLGGGNGLYAKSTTGEAIHAEANSTTSAAIGAVNIKGHGIWGESKAGNAGLVGKSAAGNGVHAESLGGGVGLNAVSASGVGVRAKGGSLAGYFEGNVQVTGDIGLVNADCAEEFDTRMQVDPGTVMVIDNNGLLEASSKPYDKRAAGIISGAGSYRPAILLDKQERRYGESGESDLCRMAVALMGKVYCKVDATSSSIEIGDLLTTSPTTGHAMKASDPFKAFGAVIGKALQPLKGGKGMIPVLVALQ